ncbi:MAG: ankyrin repeat domain-containing protein [Candidatus Berkiellales bacterium]
MVTSLQTKKKSNAEKIDEILTSLVFYAPGFYFLYSYFATHPYIVGFGYSAYMIFATILTKVLFKEQYPSAETQQDKDLIQACLEGDVPKARAALENKADPNCNEKGQTPLHIVCEAGNAALIRLLLSQKADPRILDKDGMLPLNILARKGLHDLFASFAVANEGQSGSIFDACARSVVPGLFGVNKTHRGIDIDKPALPGFTPMMEVLNSDLSLKQQETCIRKLLELGASPNVRSVFADPEVTMWIENKSDRFNCNSYIIGSPFAFIAIKFCARFGHFKEETILPTLQQLQPIGLALIEHNANPMAVLVKAKKDSNDNPVTTNIIDFLRGKKDRLQQQVTKLADPNGWRLINIDASSYEVFYEAVEERVRLLNREFNPTTLAARTTADQIQAALLQAQMVQKSGVIDDAYVQLADAYLNANPTNAEGLDALGQHITMHDVGCSHVHSALAHYYCGLVEAVDKKDVDTINEYRRSCTTHCQLGLASQEKENSSKTTARDMMDLLLPRLYKDWTGEPSVIGPTDEVKPSENIQAWMASRFMKGAEAQAKLKKASKASHASKGSKEAAATSEQADEVPAPSANLEQADEVLAPITEPQLVKRVAAKK